MSVSPSPVAHDLAARISPELQSQVQARKEDIIRSAGALPYRTAVRLGFGVFLREVPRVVEAGADALLDEFGKLSLAEIAAKVLSHTSAKGVPAHPSLHAFRR